MLSVAKIFPRSMCFAAQPDVFFSWDNHSRFKGMIMTLQGTKHRSRGRQLGDRVRSSRSHAQRGGECHNRWAIARKASGGAAPVGLRQPTKGSCGRRDARRSSQGSLPGNRPAGPLDRNSRRSTCSRSGRILRSRCRVPLHRRHAGVCRLSRKACRAQYQPHRLNHLHVGNLEGQTRAGRRSGRRSGRIYDLLCSCLGA